MNPAGIVIKLSGFSSKLPLLLWMVLEVLLKKPEGKFRQHLNSRFDDIKERLHHRYLAHLMDDPRFQTRRWARVLCQNIRYTTGDLLQHLQSLALISVLELFNTAFVHQSPECEVLCCGNLDRTQAEELCKSIGDRLAHSQVSAGREDCSTTSLSSPLLTFRSIQLPHGCDVIHVITSINPEERNHAVCLRYQIG